MKILNFCKNTFNQDAVKAAIDLGWLTPYNKWIFHEPLMLEPLRVGAIGIDPHKISTVITDIEDAVVLTEEFLLRNLTFWYEDSLMVLSTRSLDSSSSIIAQIGLYLHKWNFGREFACNNKCLFNIKEHEFLSICSNCERILSEINPSDALRIILMSHILSEKDKTKSKFFNRNIVEAIKLCNIRLQNPALNISATNLIIEHELSPGSGNRKRITDASVAINARKKNIPKKYSSRRQDLLKVPFLIASRRWNSWTPSQPLEDQSGIQILNHKAGGGYFISDGEYNLVIDPGFGFLDMLYRFHKISVMDIDAVIITHDHPDHASELQNLLGLRFVYKSECKNKLKAYLNPSSYFLYERLLVYYDSLLDEGKPFPLCPGDEKCLSKLKIRTIGVCHKEIFDSLSSRVKTMVRTTVGESKSLGLVIVGEYNSGVPFKVAIPGDTSFPTDLEMLKTFYNMFVDSDIAFLHLGSLEETWGEKPDCPASEIEYGVGGHLGLNGIAKFINLIQPKVTVITEFGEETRSQGH